MAQDPTAVDPQPHQYGAKSPIAGAEASNAWISRLQSPLTARAGGPLAGLRFAVKDNMDVRGLATTAGCQAFAYAPPHHAAVVQKLLDAGASLVGKTNLDQFACGLNGTRSPWGAVPNAFNADYVSGGSSSGSAYVVATGEVDFALGTDTAGSGRVPAGLNNIVGLKPSKGLISTLGIVPAARSVDCVSIFARTVADAVAVLDAAHGYDANDPYARRLNLVQAPLPASFRFGVPATLEFFGDRLAPHHFALAVAKLRELGGTAVEIDFAPLSGAAHLLYGSALVAERYEAIRAFFDAHESDLIEPVRSIIGGGRNYSAADLLEAQKQLRRFEKQAEPMWDRIDVLLVPTAPTHYLIRDMLADPIALNRNLGHYTNFVNLLDYAAIAVPSSIRDDGLPFGITLIGRCGSDWQLADLAQRYHQQSGLTQGATGMALPPVQARAGQRSSNRTNTSTSTNTSVSVNDNVRVAVVGAHLSGMPLNSQLTERGATMIKAARTAPDYRLFALPASKPPKPGLLRVNPGQGASIELEIWQMPVQQYGSFVALIASPLGIGTLVLEDGSTVQGFVCEPQALPGATDITHLGGWRAYINSLSSVPP